MILYNILVILSILLLGSFNIIPVITEIVFIIGLWRVLVKCGLPGWRALIPFYREYVVGEIVEMEGEGMVCMVTGFLSVMTHIASQFVDFESTLYDLFTIFIFILALIGAVYRFRIYRDVATLFRIKPKALILWLPFRFVVFCVLGFSKKHQPIRQMDEAKNSMQSFFSNLQTKVMDHGLYINLKKRVARDFLKSKTLLRDVQMEIQPGHMVLLLGGSGAGKTTLLDAVIGYEKADAEILLNERNVYEHYHEMQYEVGYVPQLDLMRGQDTAFHTLMDAAALRLPTSFSRAQRRERVEQVMDIFGLTPGRNTMVDKMSGGQRKRLSIAMEFIPNPDLFILDEPDSGLDGVMARELMQQLRAIADQGKIVVVITHTPDRVIDLFDDVIVLAKDSSRTGRLAYFGSIKEAREFFGEETMEGIVKCINPKSVGGKDLADEFIAKYTEVQHG